ncbi:DMT family transporter [Leuconostoc citreum]|uniref:DMT family transporter n=1 Tax=Leuconostoc citreum TaxID=33964 RepID=UPI003C595E45
MLYFIGLFAGFLLANQSPINAKLGFVLKSPLRSSLLSFTVGTFFLMLIYFVSGQQQVNLINVATNNPWWIWFGGLLGVIFLTSNILMFPKLGAIQTIILPIIGQVIMGVVIDTFGLFNMPIGTLTVTKVIGILLLLGGIYVAVVLANRFEVKREKKQLDADTNINIWRMWAILVGAFSAIQQAINGRLGYLLHSVVGSAVISFFSGTVVILIVVLLKEGRLWPKTVRITKQPVWLFTGGILGALFVFSTAFLVPKLGAGMTVTLSLSGSIIGSIVVAQFGWWQSLKQNVTRVQIIGIALMVASIALIKFG